MEEFLDGFWLKYLISIEKIHNLTYFNFNKIMLARLFLNGFALR
jgi:hypothetical protein